MAATSQDDEEDEERRALERELAEELAALSPQDVGFGESFNVDCQNDDILDSNGEDEEDYVRLDLERVLHQVTMISSHELLASHATGATSNDEGGKLTSWELLLQGVERSEREFFQQVHEDLHDIRTSILDKQPLISEIQQKAVEDVFKVDVSDDKDGGRLDFRSEHIDLQHLNETVKPAAVVQEDEATPKEENIFPLNCGSDNSFEYSTIHAVLTDVAPSDHSSVVSNVLDHATREVPMSDGHPTIFPPQQLPGDDQVMHKQLQEITKQQEVRESRRLKAQARHQKERDEAASLLRKLQDDFDAQEKKAEIARQEAQEQCLMANEELRCRLYAAVEHEAHENALMALADEASRKVAIELARIQDAINKEIMQRKAEDEAERHRMRVQRQLRDQKQNALARCRFSAVLAELIKHHELKHQIRDQETRKECRECVQMRAEEASIRRVIVETRALREHQKRERNRVLMLHEDEVASTLENLERNRILKALERVREEDCRGWMEKEETRTRSAWHFVDIQRIQRTNEECSRLAMEKEEERCRCVWEEREAEEQTRRLRVAANVSTGLQRLDRVFRQHLLVKCFERWKRWFEHCVEEDRVRSAAIAAKRIQMWHRSCRQRMQQVPSTEPPLFLEDFSHDEEPQFDEDDEEAVEIGVNSPVSQDAALRLQSTFRGFHVRRKFANALALAQAVKDYDEGGLFDAVDLDDLIELPPELVDGWENPILPPTPVLPQSKSPLWQQETSYQEERPEHVSSNEVEDVEVFTIPKTCKSTVKNVPSTPVDGNPPKEQSLAATLWNKMKRVKQRQQNVKQERQRQQDPTYRVQKLLNRKPKSEHNSNQSTHLTLQAQQQAPMVSWSSSNAKKKPKVKLPSLVERIRRQAMDSR